MALLPQTPQTYTSDSIDFKSSGIHAVFTPLTPFIVTGVTLVAVDVNNPTGVSLNIGNNPPNYDNLVSGLTSSIPSSGKYQYYSIGGNILNIIPGGSAVRVRVVSPDIGAISNTQRVDITGY